MPVAIVNSIAATHGVNVTLANSGANKLLAIVTFAATNDYSTPTLAASVNGVAATSFNYARNQAAQRACHVNVAYILAASYPANGSQSFSAVWSGGTVDYTRSVILELTGVAQTTPLANLVSAAGTSAGSPYSLAASLSSAVGKFAAMFGAFVGNSFTDSGGFINSTEGHTFAKSTMPATDPWPNHRMSVYTAASIASTPQTLTAEYSLRGATNGAHTIERALTGAFVVNEVPAPSVDSVGGDNDVFPGEAITIIALNIPDGQAPTRAGVNGTGGAGGSNLTSFVNTPNGGGQHTITGVVPSNAALGNGVQAYVEYS